MYRQGSDYALADGNFRLVIVGSDLEATGLATSATDDQFRLFGNADGDHDTDARDHVSKVFRPASVKAMAGAVFMGSILLYKMKPRKRSKVTLFVRHYTRC